MEPNLLNQKLKSSNVRTRVRVRAGGGRALPLAGLDVVGLLLDGGRLRLGPLVQPDHLPTLGVARPVVRRRRVERLQRLQQPLRRRRRRGQPAMVSVSI